MMVAADRRQEAHWAKQSRAQQSALPASETEALNWPKVKVHTPMKQQQQQVAKHTKDAHDTGRAVTKEDSEPGGEGL